MTSLLAVGYETRLGYDSHLESSQIWSGPEAWDCFFLIARVLYRLYLEKEIDLEPANSMYRLCSLCEANKQGIEAKAAFAHSFVLGTRSKRMHWMDARALRRKDAFRGERPWGDTVCDPWISDRETRPRKAVDEAYYKQYCGGDEAAQPVPPRRPRRGRGPPKGQASAEPQEAEPFQMRDMYMSLLDTRMQSIQRGQVATTEMIIGMYDTTPTHRWTMDEFHNVVAWPEEQGQGSRVGTTEASAMDDEDDEKAFEDAEDDEEEEDLDDIMG
ncbi:hypothetical protein LR48_Vigan09g059100 [Vigna angularis]|uniref:Uncharacterized protein n=1 Tax=Phaseolus angularis TaxID=3914 RepID=A0A0L9VAH8_PHAAN|nr:hypothetical protein LR48_Vigan09g059100 [Vigna angularis]